MEGGVSVALPALAKDGDPNSSIDRSVEADLVDTPLVFKTKLSDAAGEAQPVASVVEEPEPTEDESELEELESEEPEPDEDADEPEEEPEAAAVVEEPVAEGDEEPKS